MAKKQIITNYTMGGEWVFASASNSAHKLSYSSDGSEREGSSNSGVPKPVPTNTYWSGKGSYWTASGIPWNGTGMTCGTNTKVGDHYWSTYVFGADARQEVGRAENIEHSPIYDPIIRRIKFDWEKVDGSEKENRHHIRVATLGLIYRTGNSSYGIKSWPCPTNEVLHRVEKSTTSGSKQTGSYDKLCDGAYVKYPIGFFVNLEWQGNGAGTAKSGVPKVIIKNLRLQADTTEDPIMVQFQNYSNFAPPNPITMWTK